MAAFTGDRLGRAVRFGWWPALSLLGLLIGLTAPPGGVAGSSGVWWSVRAWGRIALTSVTAITLLVGPGLALRQLLSAHRARDEQGAQRCDNPRRPVTLAVASWVGPGLLALLGILAWLLSASIDPYLIVRIGAVVLLAALLIGCGFLRRPVLDPDEAWLAWLGALVFLVGLGRSLWSVG